MVAILAVLASGGGKVGAKSIKDHDREFLHSTDYSALEINRNPPDVKIKGPREFG